MLNGARTLITIVGFRNPGDIRGCLAALASAKREPSFAVFICENGGAAGFDALAASLSAPGAPCAGRPEPIPATTGAFVRVCRLRLGADGPLVHLGEAKENLGYAGGVNAWVRPLMNVAGWDGLWVLNPDTKPESSALAELVGYAERRGKGMVGSRIVFADNPDVIGSRGLRWRRLLASPLGVDMGAPALPPPDPDEVDRQIESPSGVSMYVTRACLERIGLMDERYFLYYEDFDWGLRAKQACGIGYAYNSIVPHVGGSTIGSARRRAERSELSVYLEFRNRLIFVRRHYRAWAAWSAAMVCLRATEFLFVGCAGNFWTAMRGIRAGLRGETGRPDHFLSRRVKLRTIGESSPRQSPPG
jgi:GT2 family glycosyltransferase